MNQAELTKHTAKCDAVSKEKSKATWHRPTVTFVPLQATAFVSGSNTDGNSGSFPSA